MSDATAGAIGGPCAAGIIFAIPIEADAFERQVGAITDVRAGGLVFREGTLGSRRVAWCVGGVGRERATRAARLLIDGHRPQAIVSAGFGGGLEVTVARGSVVRPGAVRGPDRAASHPLAGARVGAPLLVTVDRIVRTASEKQSLAESTGATIVDMETLAVAEVASEAGLPCYGIRVVSDAAADELPADLGPLITPQSGARRAGAVLGLLGRRPQAALDLWRLWERAVVDGRTLAAAIAELCESLGQEGSRLAHGP